MVKRNQPSQHHWHSLSFLTEIHHLPADIEKAPCFLSCSPLSIFRLVCQNAIDLSIIPLAFTLKFSIIARSSNDVGPTLELSTMSLGFAALSYLCRDLSLLMNFTPLGVRYSFGPNYSRIMNCQILNVKTRCFQP